MNELKIFDLNNTEDLPLTLQIKKDNLKSMSGKVLQLFQIKNQLTIDEVLVGLYRKYKIEKPRGYVSATLYNLSQRNFIKRIKGKKGTYSL